MYKYTRTVTIKFFNVYNWQIIKEKNYKILFNKLITKVERTENKFQKL